MIKKQTVVYEDIWFQVDYTWENSEDCAWIDFVATKIEGMVVGSSDENKLAEQVMLEGCVKWDGEMVLNVLEPLAFSNREMKNQFTDLLDKVYNKAVKVGCLDSYF